MVLNFLLAVSNVLALSETRRSGAPRSLTKRSRARQKSFEFKELVASKCTPLEAVHVNIRIYDL